MIVRTNESEKEKAKEGEERVERVAKLVCGRKERGRGRKRRAEKAIYRPCAARSRKSHRCTH